jgi:hypothetical protein
MSASPVAEPRAANPPAADPRASSSRVDSAAYEDSLGDDNRESSPATVPAMDELPTLNPAALAHFAEIQRALTLRESMLARALAAELAPADLRAWLAELREMPVPEAVAKIRGLLGTISGDTPLGGTSPVGPGGAS